MFVVRRPRSGPRRTASRRLEVAAAHHLRHHARVHAEQGRRLALRHPLPHARQASHCRRACLPSPPLSILTDTETAVLDFAGRTYRYQGARETDIRQHFGWSFVRFHQVLDALLDVHITPHLGDLNRTSTYKENRP